MLTFLLVEGRLSVLRVGLRRLEESASSSVGGRERDIILFDLNSSSVVDLSVVGRGSGAFTEW